MKMPRLLRDGDTVAITATSGPVNPEKLAAGVKILEGMGLRVRVMPSCHTAHEYLAAPDAIRLRDLHAAFADKKIRAIFAARGGYGAARLLPHIDYALIRRNPKIFAGYSDITALHIALNQICRLITFHAPMPAADLPNADEETLVSFRENLFAGASPPHPHELFEKSSTKTLTEKPCEARFLKGSRGLVPLWGCGGEAPAKKPGILTGGNLSIIAASIGTPFEIDTRGRILFLEETAEPPYKIDRMLLQLKHAGKLKNAAGFILGDFSPESADTIKLAVSELIVPENKPIITGFPAGHCMPNITLPLGAEISMESSHQLPIHARP